MISKSLLLFCLIVSPLTGYAGEGASHSASATELDRAARDFSASTEKLGKAIGKAVDENTTTAQVQLKKTMSQMLKDLSKAMNEATQKIQAQSKKKSE